MNDLRLVLRRLSKSPLFVAASVLTLALGVAANVALIEATLQVLYDPLPVSEPDRLATLKSITEGELTSGLPVKIDIYNTVDRALNERSSGHRMAGSYSLHWVNLSTEAFESATENAQLVQGLTVTPDYFDVLGVKAGQGRLFQEDDLNDPRVVVISQALLEYLEPSQKEPGGVIGQTLYLNTEPMIVIGVTGEGFKGLSRTADPMTVFVPVDAYPLLSKVRFSASQAETEDLYALYPVVRLGDGTNIVALQDELDSFSDQLDALKKRSSGKSQKLHADALTQSSQALEPKQKDAMFYLFGASALLLLLACANFANLLIARTLHRTRELTIRRALGASARALLSLQLKEGVVLGGLAVLVSTPLALAILRALWAMRAPELVGSAFEFSLNPRILLVGVGLAASAVLLSLAPALHTALSSSLSLNSRSSDRGSGMLQQTLVGVQVVLAVLVLVGAFFSLSSLANLLEIPLGFDPDKLLVYTYELASGGEDQQAGQALVEEMLEAVSTLPQVESIAASTMHFGNAMAAGILIPGRDEPYFSGANTVSAGFFQTLDIPLLEGRAFDTRETPTGAPAAVINRTFAEEIWPGESPIGRTINVLEREREIVGVVADTKLFQPHEKNTMPMAYVPYSQNYTSRVMLNVRLERDVPGATEAVTNKLREIAPRHAPQKSRWMTWVEGSLWAQRLSTTLLSILGLTAIALVATGLFAVTSTWVSRRFAEFGIRKALGATRQRLLRFVLARGLRPVVVGLLVGLGVSFLMVRFAESRLFEVSASNPIAYLLTAAIVIVLGALACLVPGLRAARTNPLSLLRSE